MRRIESFVAQNQARAVAPSYSVAPGQHAVRPVSQVSRPSYQRADANQQAYRPMAMAPAYRASSDHQAPRAAPMAPRPSYSVAPAQYSKGPKGLGQLLSGTGSRWKYAALGLGALAVAQFFWWDSKAPWVLRGKSY